MYQAPQALYVGSEKQYWNTQRHLSKRESAKEASTKQSDYTIRPSSSQLLTRLHHPPWARTTLAISPLISSRLALKVFASSNFRPATACSTNASNRASCSRRGCNAACVSCEVSVSRGGRSGVDFPGVDVRDLGVGRLYNERSSRGQLSKQCTKRERRRTWRGTMCSCRNPLARATTAA